MKSEINSCLKFLMVNIKDIDILCDRNRDLNKSFVCQVKCSGGSEGVLFSKQVVESIAGSI